MKAKVLIFGFSIAIFATGAPFTPRAEAYQDYALSFDGGDRVTTTNRPALNSSEITAEAWVNLNRFAGSPYHQFLICKGNDRTPGSYYLSQAGPHQFHFYLGAHGSSQVYAQTPDWHFGGGFGQSTI